MMDLKGVCLMPMIGMMKLMRGLMRGINEIVGDRDDRINEGVDEKNSF